MRRMRMVVPILAAGAWIFAAERLLAQPASNPAADKAAENWLALVDGGRYTESWKQAASLFREKVTAPQWEAAVRSAREPLGKLGTRNLVSAQFSRTLPGAPDGEYVVIRYETSFEHKKTAVETVTPMKDRDGTWRVAGYFIQ
jgi:Protein of unknown function (DUF4019)